MRPVYNTVDTCAAEFAAKTPYLYSTYDEETEVPPGDRPKVIILGSGPNRIGQGIEFDYCCVHAAMTVRESGLDQLARVGFDTLGLQTYLTAGPKESRAWTVRKGATAPEAAGVIHTDFQRGFIKAEIVSYDDLMAAGSLLKAREAGRVRMEGKDYVMQDGDVVEFRFNV